ncbi:MAG: DUF1801 domain-containing protein [Bacteroidetes bacterium]|nr:DUF1801 domain-containing protein [Bacteroidota bacterium]
MTTKSEISSYLLSLPESKRAEMETLHQHIQKLLSKTKLWFLDGKDEKGKVVSNPNIGYGSETMKYTDGTTKEFYQIGISSNTSGISVYIMGLEDKKYLIQTYGDSIGKAAVTGYCIKFKKLNDIDLDILEKAILDGVKQTSKK